MEEFAFWYDEESDLWWFDQKGGVHFGYDVSTQKVLEEWYDYKDEYRSRVWTIGEYRYSHSDWIRINKLLQHLTPTVEISNE